MTLRIVEYYTGTTIDHQITEWMKDHTGLKFKTFYPGGLYGSCEFFIPGEIIRPLIIIAGKRVEVLDGLKPVWEGQIENTVINSDRANEGVTMECTGYWGALLKRRLLATQNWGTITCENAIKHIQTSISAINSDTAYISANTMELIPYEVEYKSAADFAANVSSFGDASYNAWAAGILPSSYAASPNGEPVLFYEQQPVLTTTDYTIRVEEMENNISIGRMTDEMYNNIIINHTDTDGNQKYLTVDDNAALQDAAYVAMYGRRDKLLTLSGCGTAVAVTYGARYLALNKDARWRMNGGIRVRGTIRDAVSGPVPVSWVRAGKRIMVENYLSEIHGAGITFLITGTSYDEDTDTLTIQTGTPDPLAVMSAQLKRGTT